MLVLGANQTINAQTKTAHVDVSEIMTKMPAMLDACLLYTSDAADERSSVDLGGRRIIKKKTTQN